MNSKILISILLLAAFTIAGGTYLVGADSSYNISIAGSIDTPDKTVTIEGDTHTISTVKQVAPGDQVVADVTAPSDTIYRVYLYDNERRIVAQERGNGSQETTFDMTNRAPGSYMLAISTDGEFKAVHPIIVQGYHVDISTPEIVQKELEMNVSLTNIEDVKSPSAVKIVATNGDLEHRSEAEKQSSGVYHTTISLDDASQGEYQVYAVVQGNEDAFQAGQKEILGMSNANMVTLQEQKTTREDSSNPPTGSPTTQETTITTQTTTQTTTSTTVTSTSQPTQPTPTLRDTAISTTTTRPPKTTDSPTNTTTRESIITPNSTTTEQTTRETTSPSTPVVGFNTVTALIALLSGLYLLQRYRI